jgi:hypothetical protein
MALGTLALEMVIGTIIEMTSNTVGLALVIELCPAPAAGGMAF